MFIIIAAVLAALTFAPAAEQTAAPSGVVQVSAVVIDDAGLSAYAG